MKNAPNTEPQTDPASRSADESWELLGKIEAAIQSGDPTALHSAGEALKGAITSVLAQQAFEAASVLENTRDEDGLERALDTCRRLREAIQHLHPRRAKETKQS